MQGKGDSEAPVSNLVCARLYSQWHKISVRSFLQMTQAAATPLTKIPALPERSDAVEREPRISDWIIRHLSRKTSSGEYIAEVDGIRFVAILSVIVFHTAAMGYVARGTYAPGWSEGHGFFLHLLGCGWFGVEIFFVLSGFIVALPFARRHVEGSAAPALGRYFVRRVTRIEPPYIVALTAAYLISHRVQHFLPDYMAGLFYSHQYVFGDVTPFATHTWSLEVEVVFYVLAPWFACVYLIKTKQMRWMVGAAGTIILAYVANQPSIQQGAVRLHHFTMLPYFFAGMLLADLHAAGMLRRTGTIWWDVVVAVSAGGLVYLVGVSDQGDNAYYWVAPFAIALLFVGVFKGRIANRMLRWRAVAITGGMCYSLYLWHPLAYSLLPNVWKRHLAHLTNVEPGVVFLVFVPLVIAVCTPMFVLVEKPFMNGPGSRWLEDAMRSIRSLHKAAA